MKYNADIETCRKRYKLAVDSEAALREEAQAAILFEDGQQWEEGDLLDRAGRPSLVINKVQGVVKQVVGDARKNRPAIKIRPVDSEADPETAEVLTGLVRSIETQSDAESAYDWGLECATRSGFGYWTVTTEEVDDGFDQEIKIERKTDQFSVYLDPAHRKPTGEDANWAFESERLSREEFEKRYPGKSQVSWDNTGLGVQSSEDDEDVIWVAKYWHKQPTKRDIFELVDGQVVTIENPEMTEATMPDGTTVPVVIGDGLGITQYKRHRQAESYDIKWQIMSGSEILEKGDWAGRYIPIVQVVGEEVWVEGKKRLRSVHHHARDAQKLYNWSRSNSAETLAMAPRQPFLATQEEIEGHEEQWNNANRSNQSVLLHNESPLGRPQRQPASVSDVGAIQEAQMSADDIKATTGAYDASLGARSNETSGVAIRERKAESDNSTFVFHDNESKSVRFTGKILADLIPRIYDTERVIRILNQDGIEGWAQINVIDPMTGEHHMDLSVGKYDVVMDTGPDYQTARTEAADGMLRFVQMFPVAGAVIAPRLAKVLDWPESNEIAQELQQLMGGGQDEEPQGPSPEEQAAMAKSQIEMQKGQMDIAKGQLDMQKGELDIQGKELANQKLIIEMLQDIQGQKEEMYGVARQAIADTMAEMFGSQEQQ